MRHGVFGKKLTRDINARKALLNNLANSLIENGQINTTVAKAKFAKPFVEKLITYGKKDKLHLDRYMASILTKSAFNKLTTDIAPGFKNRQGGYTRIVKLGIRKGDSSQLAKLELLEWEKIKEKKIEKKKKNTKPKKIAKKKETKTTSSKKINDKRKT